MSYCQCQSRLDSDSGALIPGSNDNTLYNISMRVSFSVLFISISYSIVSYMVSILISVYQSYSIQPDFPFLSFPFQLETKEEEEEEEEKITAPEKKNEQASKFPTHYPQ